VVKTGNIWLQAALRRFRPRLGYTKAIQAIPHHLMRLIWEILLAGDQYQERGVQAFPQAIRRLQRLRKECLAPGYGLQLKAAATASA